MKVINRHTYTYILTGLEGLDPITVYVTNYKLGQGKVVIECFGDAWAHYWGAMGENTLQEFFVSCNNDYILNKLLKTTTQTDFDQINSIGNSRGYSFEVTSDVEVAMQAEDMAACFGTEWFLELPTCNTSEYNYVSKIVDQIKKAFTMELSNEK